MAKVKFIGTSPGQGSEVEWPELVGLEFRLPEEGEILVDVDVLLARMTSWNKNGHEVLIKDVLAALRKKDLQVAESFLSSNPELHFSEVIVLPKCQCEVIP